MNHTCAILLSILLSGCSALKKQIDYNSFTISKEELASISVRSILTTGIDRNKDPIDEVKEFNLDNSEVEIISYNSWFDLNTTKKYYLKIKWFSPDNQIFEQNDYIFKPTEPSWYTWNYLAYNKKLIPKGPFKVKIYLNNALVNELSFTVK
jgi:hypothetical protein